ncbi:uncharacterized protein LOC116160542 [Photinus pyralis]|uniref:uncharacterized protein LOC116160542 n=1 Tax=Photinus pyralis TaxID=7054 RepID=UPI0012677AF4|nr:uncharacterized protein LOC116160542 [Photinus pyralis]
MNTFTAICLLLCASLAMGMDLPDDVVKCIKDLNLDRSHIESILSNDSDKFLPENDTQFNLFFFCYWKSIEFQNEDGTFNSDKIVKRISTAARKHYGGKPDDNTPIGVEIRTQAVFSCKNIPAGESHGQTALRMTNCIDKHLFAILGKL